MLILSSLNTVKTANNLKIEKTTKSDHTRNSNIDR